MANWGYSSGEGVSAQLGGTDFDRIDDTDTHVADLNNENTSGGGTIYHPKIKGWHSLYALTETTFTANCVTAGGDKLESGDVLAAGQWHFGRYTSIDISAGVLLAYRA